MSDSSARQICPECGLPLPAGSVCPGCSLRLALSPEGAASSPPGPPPPRGLKTRFFGDYEIIGEIARGGMGVVYRARQLGLNRLVALKMIQSHHLLSDEARLRFRVEIEAVAQLHHPHIVSLYESGEHDGAHYFTMRLVEGGDLATHFKTRRSLREQVARLVKVCRAVHYAHQRGILHRDLKPSNILVDEQGEPHVADFGLAKSLDLESGFTFTSSVLGSPNYMAPEQAAGKTRQLTTAVDVYGLGAILYHLLAGRPPFQAPTPIETLRQVVDVDPAPPRTIHPDADPDLETIALKCLRKEPGGRYGSAEELAQDLERWLAGEPIHARPLGPIASAWRWSRRHPGAASLGGALALALIALAIGTALAVVRIQRAEQKSSASLRESLLREASLLRVRSELGHRAEALALIQDAAALGGPPEFRLRARNELLATLARTELTFVPLASSNAPTSLETGAVHPRFELLAHVERGTNVVFHALSNGAFRGRLVSPFGPVSRIDAFSPNGLYLALRHEDGLSVWNLRTGAPCFSRPNRNAVLAFHPREHSVVVQDAPNEAVWLELPSGHERRRWSAPAQRLAGRTNGWHSLAFSPDGRHLAGASGTSRLVELLDPNTGEQRRILTNSAHTVSLGWSTNGSLLAVGTADGKVFVWNVAEGALQWSSPTLVAPATSLAFHPGQDWLAAACEDGHVRFMDLFAQRVVLEFPADGQGLRFSPDGSRLGLAMSGGKPGWMEIQRPEEFSDFAVANPLLRLDDGLFSADGRMLAVGHSDLVILCDPERSTLFRLKQEWRMSTTAFHPRDKYMLVTDGAVLRYQPRWSVDGRLSFSPRNVIHPGSDWRALAFSTDGEFLAAFDGADDMATLFDHTLTNRLATVGPHRGGESIAVHPEGRWVTTGSRSDRSVRVWDTSNQSLVLSLPVGLLPRGIFSDDGRWLAATGDTFELRETETWKPVSLPMRNARSVLGAAAFSPGNRFLAVVVDRFTIHLFDLDRVELVGILRPPLHVHMRGLAFSPDGSKLAGFGSEARVAVWNLQRLQQRLAESGLGWDPPAR